MAEKGPHRKKDKKSKKMVAEQDFQSRPKLFFDQKALPLLFVGPTMGGRKCSERIKY